MATTLTRNLKLRIDSNLTANAVYNLSRLDLLGSTFLVDSTNQLNIRSQTDILIEPESGDIDGSGIGGSVSIGTASHILASVDLWASSVTVPVSLGLKDQGAAGSKYMRIKYKSDLLGSTDTSLDRTLSIDLEGQDRSLILGGSLGVLGGDLSLNLSGASSLILPTTGTLSTLAGVEELTNKSIDGLENTLTNIQYASLNLTNSILDADVDDAAAIQYSKLALGDSIRNSDIKSDAAILYSKLFLQDSIQDADISTGAAIAYEKLSLSGKLVNADVASNAAIQYPKLALTAQIQGMDIAPNAAIPYSTLDLAGSIQASDLAADALDGALPSQAGHSGQFLTTDGAVSSWAPVGGVSGVASYSQTWTTGTSLVVSHGLGTPNVVVSIQDATSLVLIDDITVTDSDTITLTSSEAPTGTWRVTVHAES